MGFIKGIISKYASYLLIGLALTAGAAIWYQYEQIEGLQTTIETKNKKITTLEIANQSAQETISNLESDVKAEQRKLAEVTRQNREIEQQNRIVNEELQKAKGRQEIVWKKPTLVQRMIRTSYGEFVDNFACITGAYEKCLEQ